MKLNEYSGDKMLALVAFYSVKKQLMADHSGESVVVVMANSFSETLGVAAISLCHGEIRACDWVHKKIVIWVLQDFSQGPVRRIK